MHDQSANAETPRGESSRIVQGLISWGIGLVVVAVVMAILLPGSFRSVQPSARRSQCLNNLRNVGIALLNYHSRWETFPPAYIVDETGQPLHSWRVLLLPYLDNQALYNEIDLTKAWDDPVNVRFHERMPQVFRCPDDVGPEEHTSIIAIVGDNLIFSGSQPRQLSEVTDGMAQTLLIVEASAAESFHWMSPRDGTLESFVKSTSGFKRHSGSRNVIFCDGHASTIGPNNSPEQLRALLTIDAGDDVGQTY